MKIPIGRVECEYCNRDDVILYAWHADIWCGECIQACGGLLKMTGTLEEAPFGRPKKPTYEQPWVYQMPGHRDTIRETLIKTVLDKTEKAIALLEPSPNRDACEFRILRQCMTQIKTIVDQQE